MFQAFTGLWQGAAFICHFSFSRLRQALSGE